jgi:capsular exopolysaccharide synthesis family protein
MCAASARTAPVELPSGVNPRLASLLQPSSFAADQYRGLRHVVEQIRKSAGISVLAISSPSVHDGKTTTAINLAGALAQAPDRQVLLIEADLRRPSLLEHLALRGGGGPGLTGLVANPALAFEDAVRRLLPFNLEVLPAGYIPSTPYEVLESPRLGEIVERARRQYDFVVVDTPPLVPVLDCRVIEKLVDGFLVVVAAHKTPREQLAEALAVIDSAKILGIVFNGDDRAASGYRSAYGRPERAHWWQRWRRGRGADTADSRARSLGST